MKKILIILLAICCFSNNAYGLDRFMPIGKSPEGYAYIDTYNVSKSDGIYTCRIKLPQTEDMKQLLGDYNYAIINIEINPKLNLYRLLGAHAYDASNRIINSFNASDFVRWEPIGIDTSIDCALRVLIYWEQNYPMLINKEPSDKNIDRYFYVGVDNSNNEMYIDTQSISYNPQTHIVKFYTKTILDKVNWNKTLNTRRFKSIKKKMSSASFSITFFYINLFSNEYAIINSSVYSDEGVLLHNMDGDYKYTQIPHSSILEQVRDKLIQFIR